MSWDVILLRIPDSVTTIGDLPNEFEADLGPLEGIRESIRSALPAIELRDPSWGVFVEDDYSIDFSIGKDDPCNSVMLYVRGTEASIEPIRGVCGHRLASFRLFRWKHD